MTQKSTAVWPNVKYTQKQKCSEMKHFRINSEPTQALMDWFWFFVVTWLRDECLKWGDKHFGSCQNMQNWLINVGEELDDSEVTAGTSLKIIINCFSHLPQCSRIRCQCCRHVDFKYFLWKINTVSTFEHNRNIAIKPYLDMQFISGSHNS